MKKYDHKSIERKWQAFWSKHKTFFAKDLSKKKKKYVLVEFPYPSGEGLHTGHLRPYVAGDVYSRFQRLLGKEVMYPMGWDAFGLPAENFAIKHKVLPSVAVAKNIKNAKRQIQSWGTSFDWSREVNTTDPQFYKWTQWIFLQFFKAGLAYEATGLINWCPKDKTGLANEEVIDGKCERCGTQVEKKELRQWHLKITNYAEKLLAGLKDLPNWPEAVKLQQANWIGKSVGAEIGFPIANPRVKRFVILHGRASKPIDNSYPWLKKELESRGFEVEIPEMPNPGEPNDLDQTDFVQKNCHLDEHTVIVGHSFGGIVAMRLLERGIKVHGVVFAAIPASGKFLDGKLRPTVTEAAQRGFDYKKIKSNSDYFKILVDSTDTIVPAGDGKILEENLAGFLQKVPGNKPHFQGKEEPAILDALLPVVKVFTTRPDTIFGATYMVLAPEHALVASRMKVSENQQEIERYLEEVKKKDEIARTDITKEKTGVELKGVKVINPATGEQVPVWIADYVLGSYGTGAIMAVPAHDQRDWEFAEKYGLPVKQVVLKKNYSPLVSYLMGAENIRDKDLTDLSIEILETLPNGDRKIKIPVKSLDDYEKIIRENLTPGFWNEYVGERIVFIFKYKDKQIDRIELDTTTEERINQLAKSFVGNNWNKTSVWKWLAENNWYKDIIVHSEEGILINSGKFDGLKTEEAITKMGQEFGKPTVQYKLRDWVFSRQRYWGEPIPIVHCEKCGIVAVPEKDLPVKLPKVKNYEPTGTGESPLAEVKSWVNTKCPNCKGPARRETNTMPNWAGSSWYWLRYTDPKDKKIFADKKRQKYWTPVDVYFGGMEHTTLHLLYSRFWNLFLYDQGLVTAKEPYLLRKPHGIILAEDGEKMSKSRGNVVNPDDIVKIYGADTLRMYELFLGPHEMTVSWSDKGIIGIKRFLDKVYQIGQFVKLLSQDKSLNFTDHDVEKVLHKTIKKVTEDIQNFRFNTSISSLMILLNEIYLSREEMESSDKYNVFKEKQNVYGKLMGFGKNISKEDFIKFLILLNPFAPHITEEINQLLGNKKILAQEKWPEFNSALVIDEKVDFVVQVNGKFKGRMKIDRGADQETAKNIALNLDSVKQMFKPEDIKRVVFVPNKLINFVI